MPKRKISDRERFVPKRKVSDRERFNFASPQYPIDAVPIDVGIVDHDVVLRYDGNEPRIPTACLLDPNLTKGGFVKWFGSPNRFFPHLVEQRGPSCYLYAACLCIYFSTVCREIGTSVGSELESGEPLFPSDVEDTRNFISFCIAKRDLDVNDLPEKCLRLIKHYHEFSKQAGHPMRLYARDDWKNPLEDGGYVPFALLAVLNTLGITTSYTCFNWYTRREYESLTSFTDEVYNANVVLKDVLDGLTQYDFYGIDQIITERRYGLVEPLIWTFCINVNSSNITELEDTISTAVRSACSLYDILMVTHPELAPKLSHMALTYVEEGLDGHAVFLFVSQLFIDKNSAPLVLDGIKGRPESLRDHLESLTLPLKIETLTFFVSFDKDTRLFTLPS